MSLFPIGYSGTERVKMVLGSLHTSPGSWASGPGRWGLLGPSSVMRPQVAPQHLGGVQGPGL